MLKGKDSDLGGKKQFSVARLNFRERQGKEMISVEQVRLEVGPEKTDAYSQYTFVWQPGRPAMEYFAEQLLDIYRIGLALCEGKHSRVARFLGMDRKTLDRRLAQAHRIIDGIRGC